MTERPPLNGLVEQLRRQAEQTSKIHREMSEAKSLRQSDNAEGRTDLYSWPKPEETLEGKAADEIERLKSALDKAGLIVTSQGIGCAAPMTNLNGDSGELVEARAIEIVAQTMRDLGYCDDDVARYLANPDDGDDGMATQAVATALASNHAELSERVRVLEADNALLRGLISEPSIEALAEDIAVACVDCLPNNVKLRHSAMVRLGKRLREPMEHDKARALLTDGDV
jgi:hypothetical protein